MKQATLILWSGEFYMVTALTDASLWIEGNKIAAGISQTRKKGKNFPPPSTNARLEPVLSCQLSFREAMMKGVREGLCGGK